MDNFVAIDFETANFAQSSVCSVGLPIACGLLCQRFIPKITQRVRPYLPAFSSFVVALTVGMQNSGLATSLAVMHFAAYPLATIPGAVFSVWHNISGAIVAWFYAKHDEKSHPEPL